MKLSSLNILLGFSYRVFIATANLSMLPPKSKGIGLILNETSMKLKGVWRS